MAAMAAAIAWAGPSAVWGARNTSRWTPTSANAAACPAVIRPRGVGEAPVVFGVLVIPQRLHRIEVLVGDRTALGEAIHTATPVNLQGDEQDPPSDVRRPCG